MTMVETVKTMNNFTGQLEDRDVATIIRGDVQAMPEGTVLPSEFGYVARVPAANDMTSLMEIPQALVVAEVLVQVANDRQYIVDWASLKFDDLDGKYADLLTLIDGVNTMVDDTVNAAIAALIDGAPAALDTLKELADHMAADESALSALTLVVDGKAALVHTHAMTDVTGLVAALAGKVDTAALAAYVTNSALTTLLAGKANTSHGHAMSDITGLVAALADKVDSATLSAYVTLSALTTLLAGKANTSHTHAMADITGLVTALAGKVDSATLASYVTTAALTSALATKLDIPAGTVNQYLNGTGAVQGRSTSYPARTLGVAFQVSATRDALVTYSLPITSAATLVIGSRGRLTLNYADNSAMTTNPVVANTDDFGIGSGLVVTGYATLKVTATIPAGKWVLVGTTNVAGTPAYGSLVTQETLL